MSELNPEQGLEISSRKKIMALATIAASVGTFAIGTLRSNAAECNVDLGDVCVAGVTAAPDADPVVGNTPAGEVIVVSPTNPVKGPETTDETTTTTTTSTTSTTTTVPGSTTTTVPGETTTTTTTIITAPPSLPPITVTIPPTPEHTN